MAEAFITAVIAVSRLDNTPSDDIRLTSYHIPLSAVQKWPPSNFLTPETRSWLIPVSFILQVITTIVFAGRIWARITRRAGAFGADDILIIGSWLFGSAFTVVVIFGISEAGFNKHVWDQDFKMTATGGLVALLAEAFFLLSTSLTKISILLFYRRLVSRTYSRWLQYSIYVAIAFTIVYLLSFTIFLCTFCTPTAASWQSLNLAYRKPYKCADRAIVEPLVGLISAFSDVYAIAIPEIVVSQLQMPKRQKLVLHAIFGAGSIVVIAALIRTGFFVHLHTDPRRDLTWTAYDIFFWTDLEMQFAIICACAPALKGFFTTYFAANPDWSRDRSGSSRGGSSEKGAFDSVAARRGSLVYYGREWPLTNNKGTFKPLPPAPPPKGNARSKSGRRWQTQPNVDGITVTATVDVRSYAMPTAKQPEVSINERSYMNFD